MEEKKVLSVIAKEFLTQGCSSLCLMLMGIVNLLRTPDQYTVAVSAVLLICSVVTLFLRKWESVPWDDTTREHYADAGKWTLNIIEGSLLLLGIYVLIKMQDISMNYSIILVATGGMRLVRTMVFIFMERKMRTA